MICLTHVCKAEVQLKQRRASCHS